MSPASALAVALAVFAGISIAAQQVFNGGLRAGLGSIWWAGLASYVAGTVFMVVALIATRASVPPVAALKAVTPLQWTGGVLGGVYIVLSLLALPRLGVAVVLGLVVVGQMIASMIFDHFGLFGVPQHGFSVLRVVGAVGLAASVLMIKAG